MQHHTGSELGVPNHSEGSQTGAPPPAKMRKVEEDKHDSGADTTEHVSSRASPSSEPRDAKHDLGVDTTEHVSPPVPPSSEPRDGKSPEPESGPCTCTCGGCCCHCASEPQHCVRCHTNYTFNHPQACMMPHVFPIGDVENPRDDVRPDGAAFRSVCCGPNVKGGQGDWDQPFPCFMGWHTTDLDAVKEKYNGVNFLRCDPGPGGKCQRKGMKHHAHYQNIFDDGMEYNQADKEEQQEHWRRIRKNPDSRGYDLHYIGGETSEED